MTMQKILDLAKERVKSLKSSLAQHKNDENPDYMFIYCALQEAEYFKRETEHLIEIEGG